jgi:tetratricopeptide (TPR) repeat protein
METRRLLGAAGQLLQAGSLDEAESMLQQILLQHPREVDAMIALGIVAATTGQLDLAIARLRQALEIDAKSISALCWLSYYHVETGQFEEAHSYAERAVAIEPASAVTQAALAQCLVRQGLFAEAIPHFEKSIEIDPNNPTVLSEFADALLAAKLWLKATEILRKTVLMAPEPRHLLQLAYLEMRLGKIEDAERYCRRALRKEPDIKDGSALMARILTEQYRPEEAETHWQNAERIGGPSGSLHLEKALALSAIGLFDDAIDELKQSIDLEPNQGEAYRSLVFAKRVVPDDLPLVRRMEGLLEQGSLPENDRLNLLYSLGKAFDNLGDFERAIGFFDQANTLKRQIEGFQPFDRAAFRALVDAKIALFTKKLFADWKHYRSDSALPLWVAGMMRSGTTLAEQMLTCHQQIGGAGEQSYWGEREPSMLDYARQSVNPPKLRDSAREYSDLLISVAPGFPHVIDKNPANIQHLGSFHLAFPNARMIVTRRNAIDTALSIWMTPLNTTAEFVCDRENIVFAYKECMRLKDHWREVIPSDRLLEVQYEDLVAQPEIVAPQMLEFCGLDWDAKCLHPEHNERRVRTPSNWQVRQPIYKTSTNRWKNYEPWLGAFGNLKGFD